MRILVVDNTQYFNFALVLSRSGLFDSVGYFAPWADDTPIVQEAAIGSGWDEVTREYELFDALERYDGFVFPAMYWADMQAWLRSQGLPVWGSGRSEMLERNRWLLIQSMHEQNLPVSPSRRITLERCRNVVQDGDIVKFSTFRGDIETVKHDGDWTWWYELCGLWGPLRDRISVVVQKPIGGKHVEPGFDMLVVRGQPIVPYSVGYEVKDGGYIEKNIMASDTPEPLVEIYEAIPRMLDSDYTNFLSTEVLDRHLLDITCRIPQPPGDLKLYIWKALPRIVFEHLSKGVRFSNTAPRHEWGVQLIAHNNNPKHYCKFGKIPKDVEKHVFFNRAIKIDGEVWTVPWRDRSVQDWVDALSVCGSGDSPEEAIRNATEIAAELDLPGHVLIDPSTAEHLMSELEKGYKEGIVL